VIALIAVFVMAAIILSASTIRAHVSTSVSGSAYDGHVCARYEGATCTLWEVYYGPNTYSFTWFSSVGALYSYARVTDRGRSDAGTGGTSTLEDIYLHLPGSIPPIPYDPTIPNNK